MNILKEVEDISEKLSKVGGYASLSYSSNTQSDEATSLLTKMSKLGSDISNKILFFDLWWKTQVDERNAKRLMRKFRGTRRISFSQETSCQIFT